MTYVVRHMTRWGVFDGDGRLVGAYETETEAKAAATISSIVASREPPSTPEAYSVTYY